MKTVIIIASDNGRFSWSVPNSEEPLTREERDSWLTALEQGGGGFVKWLMAQPVDGRPALTIVRDMPPGGIA